MNTRQFISICLSGHGGIRRRDWGPNATYVRLRRYTRFLEMFHLFGKAIECHLEKMSR